MSQENITETNRSSNYDKVEITDHAFDKPEVTSSHCNEIRSNVTSRSKDRLCQKLRRNKSYRQKFIQTICLWWAAMICGWISGQVGPSLLDLQIITQTTFEKVSRLITVGSIGFLLGSLTGGFLFGRTPSRLILFGALFGNAVITAAIPWCSIYEIMMVAMFVRHVFLGASDTVINAELLCIWRLKNRSYMQALHFAFAFGGIISPLATAPFLVPIPTNISLQTESSYKMKNESTQQFSGILEPNFTKFTNFSSNFKQESNLSNTLVTYLPNVTTNIPQSAKSSRGQYQILTTNASVRSLTINLTSSESVLLTESRIFIAYLITAFLTLSCSALYLFLLIKTRWRKRKLSSEETVDSNKKANAKVDKLLILTRVTVLVFMLILIGVYNAIEESFAGFVTTFCVKQLLWSKPLGSVAASVFWATFGGGRFLGIFLIRLCSPAYMIDIYALFSVLSFIGLFISVKQNINVAIWGSIVLIGFFLSVFSPTIFTWTEKLVHVTGKIASSLKIAANTGSMINSVVLGILMDRFSPVWFCYLLLGECIFVFIICIIATLLFRKLRSKHLSLGITLYAVQQSKTDSCVTGL